MISNNTVQLRLGSALYFRELEHGENKASESRYRLHTKLSDNSDTTGVMLTVSAPPVYAVPMVFRMVDSSSLLSLLGSRLLSAEAMADCLAFPEALHIIAYDEHEK